MSTAEVAIVVSGAVALLSPVGAAIVQARLASSAERQQRQQDHDDWLRTKRADIYPQLLVTYMDFKERVDAWVERRSDDDDAIEFGLMRLLGAQAAVHATPGVRAAHARVGELQGKVLDLLQRGVRRGTELDAARADYEAQVEATEALMAQEVQTLPETHALLAPGR
jgi:hypothetical protein